MEITLKFAEISNPNNPIVLEAIREIRNGLSLNDVLTKYKDKSDNGDISIDDFLEIQSIIKDIQVNMEVCDILLTFASTN